MQKLKITVVAGFTLLLAACSEGTDMDRAVIGALAGCAAGEIIDDGECLTGAAVGGLAGAMADDI